MRFRTKLRRLGRDRHGTRDPTIPASVPRNFYRRETCMCALAPPSIRRWKTTRVDETHLLKTFIEASLGGPADRCRPSERTIGEGGRDAKYVFNKSNVSRMRCSRRRFHGKIAKKPQKTENALFCSQGVFFCSQGVLFCSQISRACTSSINRIMAADTIIEENDDIFLLEPAHTSSINAKPADENIE